MAPQTRDSDEAVRIRERLARLTVERQTLQTRLAEFQTEESSEGNIGPPLGSVNNHSPAADKIALFRSLFRGRDDVYGAPAPRSKAPEQPCFVRAHSPADPA